MRRMLCVLAILALAACSNNSGNSSAPDDSALLNSGSDNDNWPVYGKTYENNRYTGLGQITPQNVGTLRKAWITPVRDDGEEEASPIAWHGTVYISTAHDNVLALDGTNGKLQWAFGYNPSYELQYPVNRGVGIEGNSLYLVTQDCRLIALDLSNGNKRFDTPACHDTSNTWYSMATYPYKGNVIVGTSGGDLGGSGLVSAFDSATGARTWDWHTVAQPGDPNHNTWPGDSYVHGGAAVWAGLAIDPQTDTVYAAPGNPGPNLTLYGRKGKNLYADSVVALKMNGSGTPKLDWYYQIIANDTHDADPAMPPVLFDGKVGSEQRKLLAVADKAGNFVILDRTNGKQVWRMAVSNQQNLDVNPTPQGVHACPNHGGGVEFNGGSYSPDTNLFYIPSTNECAVWKVLYTGAVPYVPGQPYSAGPLPKRQPATGLISAIDVATGKVKWRFNTPYPAQGGVVIQHNGLLFTSDTGGTIYALDAATGKELWHDDTGSSIVAPISAYRGSDGNEYLVVFAGEAGNQQTPNLPKSQGARVIAYALTNNQTVTNDTAGQPAAVVAQSEGAKTESGQAPSTVSNGTIPYTSDQVASGAKIYATQCSSCHGANLQGVSAPALAGPQFAHSHLNVSQIFAVVRKQMPLNAPGSLGSDQYADVMAYLLKHDCVKASPGNQPFPSTDLPILSKVTVGPGTCQ